jgi:hypothetical protein
VWDCTYVLPYAVVVWLAPLVREKTRRRRQSLLHFLKAISLECPGIDRV